MSEAKDLELAKQKAAAAAKAKAAALAKRKAKEESETAEESETDIAPELAKQKAAAAAKAKAAALAKRKAKAEESETAGESKTDADQELAKQKAAAAAKAKAAALAKRKAKAEESETAGESETDADQELAKRKAAVAAKAKASALAKQKATLAKKESSTNDDEKAKAIAAAKAKAAAAAKAKRTAATAETEKIETVPSVNQPLLDKYIKVIEEHLGKEVVEDYYVNRLSKEVPTIVAKRESYFKLAEFLKYNEQLGFDYLSDIHGTDFGTHMEVYVHLYSYKNSQSVALKVKMDRDAPEIESLQPLWAGAEWSECEAYDLLGIRFLGHPNLHRIMLGEDWVGYPLRKDYEPHEMEG